MAAGIVRASDSEMFRIPLAVGPNTYLLSAATIAVATVLSALVVRRRLAIWTLLRC